jgi:sugar lactone lactonase YvrE
VSKGPDVTGEAVACTISQAVLGEGLRWDDRRDELLAVDILAGGVYRGRVTVDGGLALVQAYHIPGTVGALTPIQGDDGWLLAAGRGFSHLAPDGSLRSVIEMAPSGVRMNDGACDAQGRFWAGTLADDFRPGGGALYRLDPDGQVSLMLSGLTISNGIGWSPDGASMYLVDSGPRVVYVFRFDGAAGAISDRRPLVTIPEDVGTPDGLTVDAEGDIWVAIYGGAQVRRYSPDGVLRESLSVPADQCTSCAFGGSGLDRLYVTTATEGWSDAQRRSEPTAGLVYRFDTTATGVPAAPYRPTAEWLARWGR